MKKIISIALLIALVSAKSFAQKDKPVLPPPQLPVDSITKLITYEEVVPVNNVNADVLYKRALDWFNAYYPNPRDVIRENDSTKFKIVGKPRFKVMNPADKEGTRTDGGLVQYTITVAAKNGRFKFELTQFNWKQASYYAIERWFNTKDQYYNTAMEDYLRQVDKYVKDLIQSLKSNVMNAKVVKDKDNW